MVAAEDERHRAAPFDLLDEARELLRDADDLVHVVRAATRAEIALVHPPIPVRGTPLIGIGDADVTRVLHGEAESGEALGEAGITDGRRPHVDAAAVSAEIHRHADDRDGLAHATGLAAGWKIATITPSAATSSPT